jgi:hypothetical protein
MLSDFAFSSLSACSSLAVLGNSREKHKVPRGAHVIRFNDWSARTSIDRKDAADTVFSNGDSHAHIYGKKVRWPTQVVFVRETKGLPSFIPRFYPAFKYLYKVSRHDLDTAQVHIQHRWATVGFIVCYNLVQYCACPIYLSGFTWELGKPPMYNHHNWQAERTWFQGIAPRFELSLETHRALTSL